MRLTDYWGVGPKTQELLASELSEEDAVEAIDAADIRTLTQAGLSQGRATRILRRAGGEADLGVLATPDTRTVYRELLDLARQHAITRHAADRIRVLTPLPDVEAMTTRLDRIEAARDTWTTLDQEQRGAIERVFGRYDEAGGDDRAAVQATLALQNTDITEGIFEPLSTLDQDALEEAASALVGLNEGELAEGVDDRYDSLRSAVSVARRLEGDPAGVLETVRSGDVRDSDAFRAALVSHVADETGLEPARVRDSIPPDAVDAAEFVTVTLRGLVSELDAELEERESTVREELEAALAETRPTVEEAVRLVDRITLDVSLAKFTLAYDLIRPEFTSEAALGVRDARNLGLLAGDAAVQPISYGLGAHGMALPEERVSVLTGANSGGKTTLLETLCQVVLLAQMGLPVPAAAARLSPSLRVVFHRRHASFNAGVLESTLRSIVPPLMAPGRTLMLVDEFEAITEPGSAADLLHGLVRLSVGEDGATDGMTLGTYVTHLAEDLEPLPDAARVDGIFASGLDANLELRVDYQPRFYELGRSTPEFIVSRLLSDATDPHARAGFETLASALGQDPVQRTLDDALFQD
jgi:DNA mismatch repair protein MutS2